MAPFFLVFVVIVVMVIAIVISTIAANKRREALKNFAASQSLNFYPDRDYSLDEKYPFLNKLCRGKNRYAYNILQGTFQQHPIVVFDYHYETRSTDSKGKRKTSHHHFSFYILNYNNNFPELLVSREGWLSKIAQWFGYDDIDFESAEFSRKFIVRSPDKKFAYDIFHPKMIQYMLDNQDLNIEIERDCLTLFFPQTLRPDQIEYNLNRLIQVRNMFPNYLMDT